MPRLTFVTITIVLLLSAFAFPRSLDAAEPFWPGWLGPKRDGWVDDFQPPARWPKELKQIWSVEVGEGYGSPLVAGDRVYQHSRQGENEVLRCLNLATGEVIWQQKHDVPFKIGGGGEWHGKGPKSCPLLADGRLFTLSASGALSAWDAASGKMLWRSNYGSRFKSTRPFWGATTSPIVGDKRVIVHFGTDDEGALVALDVETGKVVWTYGKDGAAYSSPLLVEIHGVRQIVEWNHNDLAGVESETGRLLWRFHLPHLGTNQNMPTPSVHKGHVLVGGENRGFRSIELGLKDGSWTAKEKWFQKEVALNMTSAVMNGDLVYGFSHYGFGRLFCLDSKTGEVLWKGPGRAGKNATLLSIPGHVIVLLDDGQLQVIEADGEKLKRVASYQVSEKSTWAPPVLLQNGFLVKDRDTLTFWGLEG